MPDSIAIVDCLKGDASTGKKLLWFLLVLVLPVLGRVLSFALGRKKAA